MGLGDLETAADRFWVEYSDISGESRFTQDWTLRRLAGRLRKGGRLKSQMDIARGFVRETAKGGVAGVQATGNALADTVVSTVTLGTVDNVELFGPHSDRKVSPAAPAVSMVTSDVADSVNVAQSTSPAT